MSLIPPAKPAPHGRGSAGALPPGCARARAAQTRQAGKRKRDRIPARNLQDHHSPTRSLANSARLSTASTTIHMRTNLSQVGESGKMSKRTVPLGLQMGFGVQSVAARESRMRQCQAAISLPFGRCRMLPGPAIA
jgi:hypothetical protein